MNNIVAASPDKNSPVRAMVSGQHIIVCGGPGGVGKTTVAASLGMCVATTGRSACIVTIDPARRLANAMGLDHIGDDPVRIPTDAPGALYAVMLNAERTFDNLVRRYAANADQAERILSNRLYRNLSTALSGTQEFMAAEKLYELHNANQFDCIIVDTPPTRAALDFLEAPNRLGQFLDNKLFRTLVGSVGSSRGFGIATQAVLHAIGRVTGSEVVEDTITFFRTFAGMEDGFKERANAVRVLLDAPSSSYVVVTSPRSEAVIEAQAFISSLRDAHHELSVLVINRVAPDFGPPIGAGDAAASSVWHELTSNQSDLTTLSHQEAVVVGELVSEAGQDRTVQLPVLVSDVHSLDALIELARQLLS